MDKFQYRQISIKSPLSHYVVARYYSCCSERKQQGNKTLGRALDPRANGTWLSKLTE